MQSDTLSDDLVFFKKTLGIFVSAYSKCYMHLCTEAELLSLELDCLEQMQMQGGKKVCWANVF